MIMLADARALQTTDAGSWEANLDPFLLVSFTIRLVGKTPCKTANTARKGGFF